MGKKKRSKSYYIQSAKRQKKGSVLGPDMTGFLCTCNAHERDCVREAYNVLNEFADVLYGKEFFDAAACCSEEEPKNINSDIVDDKSVEVENNIERKEAVLDDSDEEPLDIDAAIMADVSVLQKISQEPKTRRFQQVLSGAKNCIFIQTTLPDPLSLSLAIMDDILASQKQRTQKLIRMIPVQVTCKAYPEDMKRAVEKLASNFSEKSCSFSVVYKVRNNSSLKEGNIVNDLVQILQNANPKNNPQLVNPEVVLSVDIIRNVCCLSILPHYFTKYAKYNLVLLASKKLQPLPLETTNKSQKSVEKLQVESTNKSQENIEELQVETTNKSEEIVEESNNTETITLSDSNDVREEGEDAAVELEQTTDIKTCDAVSKQTDVVPLISEENA
ncbi:hypothetical protein SK128_002887 [Halocaridina rubra]|uniref:THUMP domain-containing protein n=1 Tax=Halocaridina rubra TaxID=373956 RepID=A0AAN8ZYB7_HALRR